MPEWTKIFVITACVVLYSCVEDPGSADSSTDTSQNDSAQVSSNADSSMSDSSGRTITLLNNIAPGSADTSCSFLQQWQREMKLRDPDFSLAKFYACSVHEIYRGECYDWSGYEITDVTSPDSLWSAYTVPGHSGGEPDTYVYLNDHKRKKRCMLDAVGTCCSFEDCGWLNDHTLVVVGYDKYAPEEKFPDQRLVQGFYVFYDLQNNRETWYCSRNYFQWR